MRRPKVGDRVAIPNHAVVFIIKSVDEMRKTVEAQVALERTRLERDVPWKMLTFI
jgi:hypothetical protein